MLTDLKDLLVKGGKIQSDSRGIIIFGVDQDGNASPLLIRTDGAGDPEMQYVHTPREAPPNGFRRVVTEIVAAGGVEEKSASLQWSGFVGKIGTVRVSAEAACKVRIYKNSSDAIGGTLLDAGLIQLNSPVPFVFTEPEDIADGEWIVVSVEGLSGGEDVITMIRGWYS